jgi:phage terminase large subunit GpA-like protein
MPISREKFLAIASKKLAPIFKAKLDKPVWEWCEEVLRLPAGEGLRGSDRPVHDLVPESKDVLEFLRNPNVRMITLMYSAQSSKTFTMMEATAYMMGERKVNGVFALPSTTLQTRIYNRFRSIAERSEIGLITERGKSNKEQLKFEAGNYINWALMSSPQTMAETPADWVTADEIDENKTSELDPIRLLTARGQTRPNFKILIGSTPKKLSGGGGILDYYNKSKRFVIEWLCPHCNKWELFDFESFRWPDGIDYRQIETESLAWAECPACNGKVTDADHINLVKNQKFTCLDPDLAETHVGFRKAIWHSISKNFSQVVAAYLECKDDPAKLADFWNSWCARPMDLSVLTTDISEESLLSTTHKRGEIPADVVACSIGIDIGMDSAYVVLIGWGANGRKYLIWEDLVFYGGIESFSRAEKGIFQIATMQGMTWLGHGDPPICVAGAIDAGFNTPVIYDYCRRNPWLVPVMGNSRLTAPWVITSADPKAQYGKASVGVSLFNLDHTYWQDELHKSLETQSGAPFSLEIPADVSKRYLQHLNSEVKKKVETAQGIVLKWEKPHKFAKNDLRDATVYAIFAGHMKSLHKIQPKVEQFYTPNETIRPIPMPEKPQVVAQNKTISPKVLQLASMRRSKRL